MIKVAKNKIQAYELWNRLLECEETRRGKVRVGLLNI